jgi:hypothetical protein
MKPIIKVAATNAIATALYVVSIGTFMFYVPRMFAEDKDTVFIPIAILMMFVWSASVCCALLFGRPILWYMDGRKKEAVSLIFATLGIFFVITVLAVVMLAIS